MNEELEFSASYTLSKTFDDASDFTNNQNPFDLSTENAISRQHQQQRFVFNALWELPLGRKRTKAGSQKKAQAGSRGRSVTLKFRRFSRQRAGAP